MCRFLGHTMPFSSRLQQYTLKVVEWVLSVEWHIRAKYPALSALCSTLERQAAGRSGADALLEREPRLLAELARALLEDRSLGSQV